MRMPPYLLQRPSGYYFRYTIPHGLRPLVGKSEIRKSLATHDRRQALVLAAAMSANVRNQLHALRPDMAPLPKIDFDNIRVFEIDTMEIGGTKLKGVKVDSSNPLDVAAFNQVLETLRASNAAAKAEEEAALPQQPLASPTAVAEPQPATSAGAGKNMLSHIFPIYLRQREKAGISQHSLDEFSSAFRLLVDVIGDKPITHLSQDDANHFVDIIQQLPPNRNKVPAFRGKSIDEVLKVRQAMEDAENQRRKLNTDAPFIPADLSMSARTVDKHISVLGTFLKWAIGKGYVHSKNVFEGQKIQTKAQRDADTELARKPFTAADLQTIFSAEHYRCRANAHDFWFPLIGLFSGLRLNEIAQLYLTDIVQIDGIWAFNINQDASDKKLKNATSKRLVPIHSQLLALGFLEFFEFMKTVGKVRLFPQLSYVEGSYGRQPGRSFAAYLTSIGITEKEKVFHSFRHTFNESLKQVALLPDEARSELSGHAHQSLNSNVYTSEHRLPNKQQFIEMLKFDGLVLDHLKYKPGQFAAFLVSYDDRAQARKASMQKHLAAKQARLLRNGR